MLKKSLPIALLFLAITWAETPPKPVKAQQPAVVNKTQEQNIDPAGEALRKYREAAALPMPERRDFFRNLSATDKSNLWRIHLALYLAARPEMSKEQKEIVLESVSLATPELYEVMKGEAAGRSKSSEALQSLTKRALEVFPKNEAAEIFAQLGSTEAEREFVQKYSDISALSMPDRKGFFQKSSGKDKSDLWKVHVALYLANHPGLDKDQKEILLAAISFITPELFELPANSSEWKTKVDAPIKAFTKRALVHFSKKEGSEIFTRLGGEDLQPTSNLAPGTCICSRVSDWCRDNCSGILCDRTADGCGTLWLYACTGSHCSF